MITRSKMRRQLYTGGGVARQGYGLGSLVKKAFRGIKQIAKSDVGKAALLGLGGYYLGGGQIPGLMKGSSRFGFLPYLKHGSSAGSGFGFSNILPNIKNLGTMGQVALGTGAALAFGGGDPTKTKGFDMAKRKGEVEGFLRRYYRQYKQSDWQTGWTQDEEDAFVAKYTSEYNQGGRVGLYGGSGPVLPETEPEINIQDLIQEEGIQVGPQVKELDAGAPSIVKTGNYETEDSDRAQNILTAKYEPGNFTRQEKTRLYRILGAQGGSNKLFKRLHKILMNPGMFPEAENEMRILLDNYATGGRVGALGGGVMGGRVGLKVLRDLFDDDEEVAQGGRVGLRKGTAPAGLLTLQDYMRFLDTMEQANKGYDKGEKVVSEVREFMEKLGDKEYEDFTKEELAKEKIIEDKISDVENMLMKAEEKHERDFDLQKNPMDAEFFGDYASELLRDLDKRDKKLNVLAEKAGMAQGGRIGYAGGPKKMNQDGLEFIVPVGQSEEKAFYDAIINDVDGIMSEERKSEWLNLLVPQLMESGEMSGTEKDETWNAPLSRQIHDEHLGLLRGMNQGGRIGAFGGGVMGIGTPGMRLPGIPQMAPDGLEYNMKAGGFQNLGAQEGKDDVNAKLAKNEFVMTADAVRGAGGGSIEKGAQRMYDTMKQLEGKVA